MEFLDNFNYEFWKNGLVFRYILHFLPEKKCSGMELILY